MQADYDYYDAELLKYISGDWQKASKVIGQFLSKAKETTGDAYLLWRLRKLAEENRIEMQGEMKNKKDFEIKTKSAQAVES